MYITCYVHTLGNTNSKRVAIHYHHNVGHITRKKRWNGKMDYAGHYISQEENPRSNNYMDGHSVGINAVIGTEIREGRSAQ